MITFVTHLRYDNHDRIENLNTIIRYYSNNIRDVKFIFIEDDREHNKAFDLVNFVKGKTSFNFVKNDSIYYRTRALNIGIKMAQSDVVVSLDTDCIVPIESLLACKDALLNGATVAWPYNGYFVDVSQQLRNKIVTSQFNYGDILQQLDSNFNLPLSSSYKDFHVRCTNNQHLGTGGIVMFNRSLFIEAGGYNENFIGWGCEDNEIVSRLDILEHKKFRDTRPEAICFHLFHRSAQRAENPFFNNNSEEWHKVKDMTKIEMLEYISKWRQFK